MRLIFKTHSKYWPCVKIYTRFPEQRRGNMRIDWRERECVMYDQKTMDIPRRIIRVRLYIKYGTVVFRRRCNTHKR